MKLNLLVPFCPKLCLAGKTDSSEQAEKFQPAEAGEFPYGTYHPFALQMRLGAQRESEAEGRCLFAPSFAWLAKRTAASKRKNSNRLKPGNFRMAPTIHLLCKCG